MQTLQQKEPQGQLIMRIAVSTKKRTEALAQATRRSKSFVVEEAINQYFELNEWQIESIERGLEDVKAGRVISPTRICSKSGRLRVIWTKEPRDRFK